MLGDRCKQIKYIIQFLLLYVFYRPHMQSMRNINDVMASLLHDPFGMLSNPSHNAIANGTHRSVGHQNDLQILPFGFPPMPSFNIGNVFSDFVC